MRKQSLAALCTSLLVCSASPTAWAHAPYPRPDALAPLAEKLSHVLKRRALSDQVGLARERFFIATRYYLNFAPTPRRAHALKNALEHARARRASYEQYAAHQLPQAKQYPAPQILRRELRRPNVPWLVRNSLPQGPLAALARGIEDVNVAIGAAAQLAYQEEALGVPMSEFIVFSKAGLYEQADVYLGEIRSFLTSKVPGSETEERALLLVHGLLPELIALRTGMQAIDVAATRPEIP